MTKIMIVDDQEMVREGLRMILSLHEEVEIVGEAGNGERLLEILKNMLPDVILMDIRMPVMDGIETLKIVKETYPSVKVIILTTFNEDEYIFNGLKFGADGYIYIWMVFREKWCKCQYFVPRLCYAAYCMGNCASRTTCHKNMIFRVIHMKPAIQ